MRKVNREDLLNGWLKYHNTTVAEVITKHPKEVLDSPDWFKLYPCTQEQHDEWLTWAKEYTKKVTGIRGLLFDKSWGFVYLDCAPYVKKEVDEKT